MISTHAWNRSCAVECALVERLPLATSSQHVEDRVGTVSISGAWSSASKAMGIDVDRQQRLQYRPQLVGDLKPCRGRIIRRPLPFSFLGFFFAHTSSGIHV